MAIGIHQKEAPKYMMQAFVLSFCQYSHGRYYYSLLLSNHILLATEMMICPFLMLDVIKPLHLIKEVFMEEAHVTSRTPHAMLLLRASAFSSRLIGGFHHGHYIVGCL